MKIYNKIVLEWNEETQNYDKVVEEDSFEHEGELMLAVPWLALASLAKGAFDVYSASKNKPKWKDYEPSRKYLDKYTASLRGRGSEAYSAYMKPQIRQIGSVSRKMARERRYAAARSGLEGSGIVAQERLSAGQNILESMQKAGEQASIKQMEQEQRSREAIASATMQHEQRVDVAKKQFEGAQRQHSQQMTQAVGNLGFSAATMGIGHMQKVSGAKAALGADNYQALRDKGYSLDQLTKMSDDLQTAEMGLISSGKFGKDAYLRSIIGEEPTSAGVSPAPVSPDPVSTAPDYKIDKRDVEGAFGTQSAYEKSFPLPTLDKLEGKEPPPIKVPEKKTVYPDPTGKFSGELGRGIVATKKIEGEKKAKAMNVALEKQHEEARVTNKEQKIKQEALKSLTYSNLQGKKYSGKLPSGESVEGWVQHVSGDKIHISWRDPSKPSAWSKKGELQRKTISKDDWYKLGFELLGEGE